MTGTLDVVFNLTSFNWLSSFFSKEIIAPFGSIQAELDTALSYRNNCLDTKTKQKNTDVIIAPFGSVQAELDTALSCRNNPRLKKKYHLYRLKA